VTDRPWVPGGAFPATRLSVLQQIRSPDRATRQHAYDSLVAAYWRPVYKYLRVRWRYVPEDAEDATQGFLAAAFEKQFFDRFDPAKARFRTFFRVCLDRFVQNQQKAERRLKRGGDHLLSSLDFENAEGELQRHEPVDPGDLDQYFRQEVVRSLFAAGVDAVRERCRQTGRLDQFALFERYDLSRPEGLTYADLAAETGLSAAQVTNHLAAMRRLFRNAVLERLRDMTGSEEEFRLEARDLLGAEVE
jgi:RNA polymerase sigma factor (sigma-70 family)